MKIGISTLTAFLGLAALTASAAPVVFTELTGVTGGTLAATGVYRADLSSAGVGNILSITIKDNSSGLGGAPGQFSGFDLDAIKLSYTSVSTAGDAKTLAGLGVFDFSPSGTLFTPGTQRVPTDPKLFGTDAGGTHVDNSVATLGLLDGESTTAIPGAAGFVSMGDNGILSFNLTSPVDTSGLFLYIGEVGNNGEVAAGSITVSENRVPDAGSTLLLLGVAMTGLVGLRRFRRA